MQVLEIDQQDLEVDLPRTSSEFLSVSVNALTAGKLWMAGQAQLQTVRAQLKKKETEEYLRLLNQVCDFENTETDNLVACDVCPQLLSKVLTTQRAAHNILVLVAHRPTIEARLTTYA